MREIAQLTQGIILAMVFVALLWSQGAAVRTEDCGAIAAALQDYGHLKTGMTRSEVEETFREAGGIQVRTSVRYVYKRCRYIKLTVEYEPQGESPDAKSAASDVVRTLSELSLGYPVMD